MPTYNKLVRDLIPQIIEKSGKQYTTRILDDTEYITALKAKLYEELQEYLEAKSDQNATEELADILELILTLAKIHGSSQEQLEKLRDQKANNLGGFDEKIFLIEVSEN